MLKVKNKLDSRFYAIKRIRINPNNEKYNRLITREIKLLSRLNHENVVRYYSTWKERYVTTPSPDSTEAAVAATVNATKSEETTKRKSQSQDNTHSKYSIFHI